MKKVELSFINQLFNLLLAPIIFWVYYFCLTGIQQTRQIGNVVGSTIQGHIMGFMALAMFITQVMSPSGVVPFLLHPVFVILAFIVNVILQIVLGWKYRRDYMELLIDEFFDVDTSEDKLHNVSPLRVIGFAIDNLVLKLITFVIGTLSAIAGFSGFSNESPTSSFIFLMIAALFFYFFKRLKDREKLEGKEFEKSVENHYSKMEKVKKVAETVEFFDK